MFIQNPPFLSEQPRPAVQSAVLLVLLMAAAPLAANLPAGVMLMFAVLLAVRFILMQAGRGRTPPLLLVLLLAAAGLLVWTQVGSLFGREGGISFLLLMVVLKAFESNTRRDWQVLLLSMLFLMGGGVLFNQSLPVGLWTLLSLFALSICFGMLGGLRLKEAVKTGAFSLLLTLPLMVVLFVAVPRKSEPLWRIPQQKENQAKTGLSNTMRPGSISNLVQSDEWVANVVFQGSAPERESLYWRAVVMTDFDGSAWHAQPDNTVDGAGAGKDATVHYQIIVRDQNGALPALDQPAGPPPRGIVRRLGNVLKAERSHEGLRRLNLSAQISDTLPDRLSEPVARHYLHLPQGNMRVRMLAQNLMQRSAGPRGFIQRVLDYYRGNAFAYTLQPPLTQGADSVDEFMFRTKQGFCEHYAQSFVVMMRAAGLPARVVAGYLGADHIPEGNFWQIRAKDAHAWAEVWLPEEQVWLRVDPTAAVSSQRVGGGLRQALSRQEQNLVSMPEGLAKWRETGQFYWQQWVVDYDQSRQNNLFAKLGLGGFRFGSFMLVLIAGGLLALLPVVLWWHKGRRSDRRPLEEGFALLKSALLGNEETRHAVTASELRAMMAENGLADEALERLLQKYEQWQYAAATPPKASEQHAWLKQAEKAAKRYRQKA